jgi:ADP-L-glycero-D-manno-heptose 6-epimerase
VDDFSSADFRNLQGFKGDVVAAACEELDWEAQFDVPGQVTSEGWQSDVKCIYHLASITDTTVHDQALMVRRNVEGFRCVLRFALGNNIPVVYASSAATYGQADGVMREEQPAAPVNVYGFSKTVLDNLARQAAAHGLPVAGVRYFNVYGPHEAHKGKMASMVYQLYRQMAAGQRPRVFKSGEQMRDFVYVKDAVAGTIAAAESGRSGVYNIGSGRAISFNHVIELLNAALGLGLKPEYIDNPYSAFYQNHTEADLTRSRFDLDYDPQWPPERGIADYVAWLKERGA